MKYFNLDVLAISIVLIGGTLLILPIEGLLAWWLMVPLVLFVWITRQYWTAVMIGIVLCWFHWQALQLVQQAEQIAYLPKKQEATFTIVEILHQQAYQTLVIEAELLPNQTSRIYTTWQAPSQPKLGEIWQGELRLRPLSSRLNQGGFDRQKWAFAKGITGQAVIKSAVKIGEDFSWRQQRLNQALQHTANLEQQGLLLALAFGERAWFKPATWLVYQQTNTAHLIAISGLHIGLAMSLGFGLIRLLQWRLPTYRISPYWPLLGGLLLAGMYSELAGFSIPTFRAIIALGVVLICRLGRVYFTVWQLFVRTLAVLLLWDPFMMLSDSFWLSVGAVGCLIVWYQVFPLSLLEWRGVPLQYSPLSKGRYILGLLHLQLGLLWLFTPIQLLMFYGMSLHSFWANLIIVPIFSLLLVPIVLFATFTAGALGSWSWANNIAVWCTEWLNVFSDSWVYFSGQQIAVLTFLLAGLFSLTCYFIYQKPQQKQMALAQLLARSPFPFSLKLERSLPKRLLYWIYFLTGVIAITCLIFWSISRWENQRQWRLESLDVGQGLATLIVKNGHAVLYDTGGAWAGGNMAQLEILPYLRRQGIVLEQIIISHDDNDHAGGVDELLLHYPHAALFQSSYKNYEKTDRTLCYTGKQWEWRGLLFTAVSPNKPVERAGNEDSCVVLIEDAYYRVLLTGDADIATERKFAPQVGKIDVLQVGHHGSKTSTSALLLAETQPDIALISSGRWNAWGMPHFEVIERLHQHKSAVYNSAFFGQVSLIFQQEQLKVTTARHKFSPWYRRIIGERGK
ncbi:DNA internalization-related competence protein ComEC/Rec2 [Conservatibacter flavescens]|uniref:DNA internalization-related competence protein ComEC/Rec2 n=1 Tax=Conservatibacter flavescens TaxID=28161 RepID=A0A2M8S3Z4_9PAST|nr:DNA internalization-related competence protein ComEC/Rec2 [Conservatibacter flavescens]PJG85869.1 DNA internalization-related competence protein ComEC/Rec2 [Conservatibacter flavescens]